MDALNRAGLIRYLQPKAWGGMELPFTAYYDMPEVLSRGDISVGWTVHNLASHHRTVGWYEMKAQEEVWGPNPDVCVASGIAFQQGRRSEEHTSELQSQSNLVCRLLLEKKKKKN